MRLSLALLVKDHCFKPLLGRRAQGTGSMPVRPRKLKFSEVRATAPNPMAAKCRLSYERKTPMCELSDAGLQPPIVVLLNSPCPSPTPGVGEGQGGLACCDSWGRKESHTTERLI